MSTPNQPGSDQKSESTSGSTPSTPEQATAPAGAEGSKPSVGASTSPVAGKQVGPAPAARVATDKSVPPVGDKPITSGSGAPVEGKSSAAPLAPKAPESKPVQARGSQVPPWQRGQQGSSQPQQQVPQTNINRPPAPRPDVGKGQPQVRPSDQRPPSSGVPSKPSTRPVITGTAAPKAMSNTADKTVANQVVGNTVVSDKAVDNKAVPNTAAENKTVANKTVASPKPSTGAPAGLKAKAAAALDGPTRHISRKDLPKDLPDLSEAKHPLPAAAVGDKNHIAAMQVADGAPLRATVQIRRIDPWTTLKVTSVISVSLFFVWMVAVGLLYVVLDGMGVWDRLNNAFTDIVADGSSGGLVTAGQVFGYSAVIGLANMVLLTALVTIGSFIYNLCSDLVGGVEVTLADRD